MPDQPPRPDDLAEAAKELAAARSALEDAKIASQVARSDETSASNRVVAAETKLRALTDQLVPPEGRRR